MESENAASEMSARELAFQTLRGVIDPELGVNIVDLGLVYDVSADSERVEVQMSLTTPACPMGQYLVDEAWEELHAVFPPTVDIDVKLVWEPQWQPEMMSGEARSKFGWK